MTDRRASSSSTERVLVIKLGAMGNVVLSFGPFAAIRRHHASAQITLLTTAPYATWLATSPWFDKIWRDERPPWWDFAGWLRLRRQLIDGRFDRIYDLQTSSRSSHYFQLLLPGRRPEWSGIAHGCALPDGDPDRNRLHDIDRQFGQLLQAGVAEREPPDLTWSHGAIGHFAVPERFALLAPGSSPHRLIKRWPIAHYGQLAVLLAQRGVTPVVIGTAPEHVLAKAIVDVAPTTIDLTGRTDFPQLTSLARNAHVAIGNDTGPMHLIAAAGCPSIVLFSRDSEPELCAPRGHSVRVLYRADLGLLDAATVLDAIAATVPVSTGVLVAG